MENENLVSKNENRTDLVSKTRTIYEAGAGEIFWKNFLAGFSRGLGGVFTYLIFLVIISVVFVNFVLPKLLPSITGYMTIFKSMGSISNTKPGSGSIIPENLDIQKLLGQ